ncbi:DUF2141 domain-containing protein [Sandaracinus amylolyticus]|uniref:DUF2141 domain-containing protein n=1 Tax=Sandaracinus amylolyticus TaxID=927083 RepID=UPI00069EDAA0|nr:DUF2141 domain-containing protein [Sandaracinus amylolyticus]
MADSGSIGSVVVHVRGLRRERGVALVALFDPHSAAERSREHALHVGAAPIAGGTAEILFRDVRPGRYAASLVRSEDDVDHAGVPTYADVVFEASGDETHVELTPHETLHAP